VRPMQIPQAVVAASVTVVLVIVIFSPYLRQPVVTVESLVWILVAAVSGIMTGFVATAALRYRRRTPPPRASVPGGLEGAPGEPRRYLVPADLPPPPTILLGREQEIAHVRRILEAPGREPKIVVLSGPTGIGRSALAITVADLLADHYPDGQVLIDADGQPDIRVDDVLAAFYWALRGPLDGGDDHSPTDLERWYKERTAALGVLVILDNFTSLAEIQRLLPAGQRCALIVTSPAAIPGLRNVETLALSALHPPAARKALLALIGRPEPAPASAQASAVDRIVAATAMYPVALHIAAAALVGRRSWTLELAVQRMSEVRATREDVPGLPPFVGALDLSFAMLTEQERLGLVLLGLLRNTGNGQPENVASWMLAALLRGCAAADTDDREPPDPDPAFTRDDLDVPAGGPADGQADGPAGEAGPELEDPELQTARQLLDRLADARLAHQRFDTVGVVTHRLPKYVWAYSRAHLSRLVSPGQQDRAVAALRTERERRGGRRPDDLLAGTVYRMLDEGRLAAALEAARDAVTHSRQLRRRGTPVGEAGEGLGLAALAEVYAELGWIEEGMACAEAAQRAAGQSRAAQSRAHRVLGQLRNRQHRLSDAFEQLNAALLAARQADDVKEQIRVLRERTVAHALARRPGPALQDANDAQRLCDDAGPYRDALLPAVLWARGVALLARNNLGEAADVLRDADRLTREDRQLDRREQPLWRAWIRHQRALVALRAGHYGESRKYGLHALDGFTDIRHRYGMGHSRLVIGRAYLAERRIDAATATLEEALTTLRSCGDRWIEAEAAITLAQAYRLDFQHRQSAGTPPRARQLLLAAEQIFARLGDIDSEMRVRRLLDDLESVEVVTRPEPAARS
jgi:tetratricopeptide (TPR) repeat protein